MAPRQSFIKQTVIHCSRYIFCIIPDGKSKALQLALTKGERNKEITVRMCVFFHLYVSPSPRDRKEVLEVAGNADCELSTVTPPLNPTSFESTKAFLPLFFTQPEIIQLQ